MNYHNWDSYDHQTLYDRIHGKGGFFLPNGAGVSGAAGAQEGWSELSTLMAQARERTEAALSKAGAVWEGDAGDAMQSGITPLARWADDAHTASVESQRSTDVHVDAYAAAKNQMPEPVRVTSTANGDYGGIPAAFTHLVGGQTDQDQQEAAAQEAKAEAVRTMQRYEAGSATSAATLGQFVPPPSVVVEVPRPQGGDVIPGGVTEWPGTGRVQDGTQPGAGPTPGDSPRPGNPGPGGSPGPGGTTPHGADPTPAPGDNTTPHDSTAPSGFTSAPQASPVTTGLGADRSASGFSPGVGAFGGPGESGTPGGRGPAGRAVGGGGPEGRGGPEARRPGGPGASGLANDTGAGRAGARGASGGTGVAPGGGRSEGDEDKEHKAAEYLRATHDDFWDDATPVAPAVIGDEDDE